ncbi:hypothetical protein Q4Q35_19840 [Flavivirga aquimarina]|uniref:Uncharacterized protein n=1 Tax=Flavivirga aquimarina TaxID=2027862 RepID=A0ABT8WFX5_9FLAO|nr:hypothetical protein [Flavivirga aquimarina]MDO5972058.1 hypothetical protein [Flavivirga aquimarina]
MESLTYQENKIVYRISNGFFEKGTVDILYINPITINAFTRPIGRKLPAKNIAGVHPQINLGKPVCSQIKTSKT